MPHIIENRGRPSKICPEARAKILAGIQSNLPYEYCAYDAEIHPSTIYNWLNQGEADKLDGLITEHSLFFDAVKRAEAQKMRGHLDFIEGCPERWQARMTILERRWREYWGQDALQLQDVRELKQMLKEHGAKKDG